MENLWLHDSLSGLQHELTTEELGILKRLQKGDNLLYQYFVRVFNNRVDEYGPKRLANDVRRLQLLR